MIKGSVVKKDFPVLRDSKVIYLDSTATAQRPLEVIEAEADFYRTVGANAHRGLYSLAIESTQLYENSRAEIAKFINAGPEELTFVRNTTEGINLVAYAWAMRNLRPGDVIISTVMEHHSNMVPWQIISQIRGVELKFVGITEDGRLDIEDLKKKLDKKVKIVAVTHVSNVLGTINPIKEICALAHENGAVCLVDGAQGAPHIPMDVKDVDCDFYAFSGHKMMGPMGIGALYIRQDIARNMGPFLGGGEMINRVKLDGATYAEPPLRFEAGTQNVGGAIGLAAAVRYLKGLGMADVMRHEQDVGEYARYRLSKIKGIRLFGPEPGKGATGGIATFVLDNHHPHDIADFLNQRGIAVRAGDHCAQPLHDILGVNATTRASFYIYNDTDDVDALFSALNDLATGRTSQQTNFVSAEHILDYYFNAKPNEGPLKKVDRSVHRANPMCGDEITIEVAIKDDVIDQIRVVPEGCKISVSSAYMMSVAVKGKKVLEALELADQFEAMLKGGEKIKGDLGALGDIVKSPARMKCAMLAWNALREVLKDDGE